MYACIEGHTHIDIHTHISHTRSHSHTHTCLHAQPHPLPPLQAGLPYDLDPLTLATRGETSLDGQLVTNRLAGHFRWFSETGGPPRLVTFSTKVTLAGTQVSCHPRACTPHTLLPWHMHRYFPPMHALPHITTLLLSSTLPSNLNSASSCDLTAGSVTGHRYRPSPLVAPSRPSCSIPPPARHH